MVQKMGWATAQLCHNTMGICIVTQQFLGVKWVVGHVTIQKNLHCDLAVMRLGLAGKLYCNRGSVLKLRCDGGWKIVLQ